MPSTTFSAKSAGPVYGDDWSAWQRDLYPFTYQTDATKCRRMLGEIDNELRSARNCLYAQLKHNRDEQHRVVAGFRREIDKLERWRRNGETQLRLIDAARPAARDIDDGFRLMPTRVVELLVGAR